MDDENFVKFGEEGAREGTQLLTYGSYLRLPQLLDSQHLESDPPAHDELLFITIHQSYELWFKQLLHEAETVRDALVATRAESGGRDLWFARHLLSRMHVIERVLVQQVDVLETMTPQDFLEFRQRLAPASGFQSVQFRELEFLSGAKDEAYVRRFRGLTETEQQRLARRLDEPTLWDGFVHVLAEAGLDTSSDEAIKALRPGGRPQPLGLRRHLGARRGAAPARRARRCLARTARRDGGTDDRVEDRDRGIDRVDVPPRPARPEVLPTPLGTPLRPLTNRPFGRLVSKP